MNQAIISNDTQKRARFSAPVLIYAQGRAQFLSETGEISNPTARDPIFQKLSTPPLVCHAPYTSHRTGIKLEQAFDILELFAFVHPTKFCVPTPSGILKSLGQSTPYDPDEIMIALLDSVDYLLDDLLTQTKDKDRILALASAMGLQGRGWLWTPIIFSAFGLKYDYTIPIEARIAFNIWNHLPEWSEHTAMPTPQHFPITADDVRARLDKIVSQNPSSEQRSGQINYTTRLTETFRPKTDTDGPYVTLAEAGTGVGKTLGYLAPVTVWTETNDNPVWISTYTKNLQRQIDAEINKIYPDPAVKDSKIAVRKGRENYLCLLNFEDQALSSPLMQNPKPAIASGIMARWIATTKDGDLSGADFPGWLANLLGNQNTLGLADRRGECIYSACDHYQRCFAERSIRKASSTPIVVANHATVMIQTAMATENDPLPNRYIFDEGHHLFHAADNVYCTHITGNEGYELRRWLTGPETGGRKSRARGLKKRIENVLTDNNDLQDLVFKITNAALKLPPENWLKNLSAEGHKTNFEQMISALHAQTLNRTSDKNSFYSLETPLYPLEETLEKIITATITDLNILNTSMQRLINYLHRLLTEDVDKYSADQRKRIDILMQSLTKKTKFELTPWIETLSSISKYETSPDIVDWIEIEKNDGKIYDIGIYRHLINPMKSFAQSLKPNLHAAIMTSATLRDQSGADSDLITWQNAIEQTGTDFLTDSPIHFSIPSPFSYKTQTKVIIVTDINKNDHDQIASAYRELFLASKGGALGLFTSIQKLKYTHGKIESTLAEQDITLYSQHTDGIDTGTLVDMFRDDTHSCLLGTDAIRDGVDVPGESLRLIVFDRVPWPRPNILHKARRKAFGDSAYDDRLTRLKIKQAFGRLIRQTNDHGVFIMLDSSFPSRLLSAFPTEVEIQKVGIQEAIHIVKNFLHEKEQ